MSKFQEKYDNERDGVARAKQLTKEKRTPFYCIRSTQGFITSWYVEDEAPMIRAFEEQVYPKS